ncbi:MAG: AAA family ATPase [Planctomycetota bacterium]
MSRLPTIDPVSPEDRAAMLGEYETMGAWDCVDGAAGSPSPPDDQGTSSDAPVHAPKLLCMADVEPAEIAWLWRGRIPLGRLTLLVGRPGEGKSFLTAYLAATVSQGRAWVDRNPCQRGSVILCSAEDDPKDTIAPRLIAHDADRSRVHLLAGVMSRDHRGDPVERVFTLDDLVTLRHTLDRVPDCKLIVIDPIGSYLGGGADAHRDNEVRSVLAPVCHLAAARGAAVLVVAHARKAAAPYADDLVLGSRAFTGIARSVLHLVTDPQDEKRRRRLLLTGKNNLAERLPGFAFEIGPGDVEDRPCVCWHEGEVNLTADDAVNMDAEGDSDRRTQHDEAVSWLRKALVDGPKLGKALKEDAREGEGISWRTLERAKKTLSVEAFRPENPGPWYWRLPDPSAPRQGPGDWRGGGLAVCPGGPESQDDS